MDQPGESCNRQRNEVLPQSLLHRASIDNTLEFTPPRGFYTKRVSIDLWDLVQKEDRKAGVLGHSRASHRLS